MGDEKQVKVRVNTNSSMGMLWFAGWLFTIGFLHLAIPRALFALILWPYYLGKVFAH